VGELATVPPEVLEATLGGAHGRQLGDLARGVDDRGVEPDREVKSVSHEETYPDDVFDRDELDREIVRMADAVASRMRRAGLVGRTVGLKIRYGDFVTLTRSRTCPTELSDGPLIAAIAAALLAALDVSPGVRLLGVGVSNLSAAGSHRAEQMSFELAAAPGPPAPESWHRASGAVDAVRDRFGEEAVGPARLLAAGGIQIKRPGDTQWGPSARDTNHPGA
jgi:DNA polymerase-4